MNQNRRKFMKILLVGGGVLLVEGIMSVWYSKLFNRSHSKEPSLKKDVNKKLTKQTAPKFRIRQNNQYLSIYDSTDEEIFQIDNGI